MLGGRWSELAIDTGLKECIALKQYHRPAEGWDDDQVWGEMLGCGGTLGDGEMLGCGETLGNGVILGCGGTVGVTLGPGVTLGCGVTLGGTIEMGGFSFSGPDDMLPAGAARA